MFQGVAVRFIFWFSNFFIYMFVDSYMQIFFTKSMYNNII